MHNTVTRVSMKYILYSFLLQAHMQFIAKHTLKIYCRWNKTTTNAGNNQYVSQNLCQYKQLMFHIQNPDKIPTKCLGHETLSFSSHEYCLTCQVFHQFIFCFFLLNCIFFLTYQLNISWLKLFLLNFLPCLFDCLAFMQWSFLLQNLIHLFYKH